MIVTMLGVTWKIRSWKTGKVPFRPLFVYKSQNPYTLDYDLLIKNNEIEERYNLSVYNRNTTNSTELITSKCYTYFMANNIHKEDVYEILNRPDGSHPSDDELLKLFNKESLHLKEFQTKQDFDRFKRKTTLTSDSYGGVLLYGEVSDKYRRKQNAQSDAFSREDFNKNEKLIERLVVYTSLTVGTALSPIIYDTDGNTHEYMGILPEIDKKDEKLIFTYTYAIDLSRQFLLEHSSGFELKIESGDYSKIIIVPDTMAKSFLDALDSI